MKHRLSVREQQLFNDLRTHLAWASRVNPNSGSRKHLRKMFAEPEVLDLIEVLVKEAA